MAEQSPVKADRPSDDWRNRENRQKGKYLAKRVEPDVHKLVTEYAKSMNTEVSKLLAPAVEELIDRARAWQAMAS
ncbi:hypothetical protein [Mycobacteroides chelonae]|jgi:hypothetical protein|uniref:hypothetical protein n=1 Tax=Mycobacteroides chelonae TaxID=1774 RepID=UPI0008A8A808|nr:hypothetical protein [Mycobacteroides chelonae]OHT73375.1 hypothetical protein BKG66_07970 [Mycobacteroides chelonae]OHT75883.1 hypothetical protein BKG67_04565 [Mycobacteroides chelonae]